MTGAEETTEKNCRRGEKNNKGLDYLRPLWGTTVTGEVGLGLWWWPSLGRGENRARNRVLVNMAPRCSGLLLGDRIPVVSIGSQVV